jgi:hypothetical protein
LEYSKTRLAGAKILFIICRFKEQDIAIFQDKKIWSEYEELFTKRCLGIYAKWYCIKGHDFVLVLAQ